MATKIGTSSQELELILIEMVIKEKKKDAEKR